MPGIRVAGRGPRGDRADLRIARSQPRRPIRPRRPGRRSPAARGSAITCTLQLLRLAANPIRSDAIYRRDDTTDVKTNLLCDGIGRYLSIGCPRGNGRVVITGESVTRSTRQRRNSDAAFSPRPQIAPGKAAVRASNRVLAAALAERGIGVDVVVPGATRIWQPPGNRPSTRGSPRQPVWARSPPNIAAPTTRAPCRRLTKASRPVSYRARSASPRDAIAARRGLPTRGPLPGETGGRPMRRRPSGRVPSRACR